MNIAERFTIGLFTISLFTLVLFGNVSQAHERTVQIPTEDISASMDAIQTKIKNSEDRLLETGRMRIMTDLTAEFYLVVKAKFEARPIGGILSVRVSVHPTFTGVGTSNRAVVYRSLAVAVDDYNSNVLNNIVDELTKDIIHTYASEADNQ